MSVLLRVLITAVALAIVVLTGCAEERDDHTTPSPDSTLPPLGLTDETPDLLLTWLDDRGATHTGVDLAEVPEASNKLVRVITRSAGHGSLFYVADLSTKQQDGRYTVRVMRRAEWESLIDKRRAAYRAKHTPPPPPPTSTAAASGDKRATPISGLVAVVYGAAWCKPCHQATAYLKKRGVAVVEYDIEKQPARAAEMRRKLRDAGVRAGGTIPIIDVGGIILKGFSQRAVDRAIDKAGGIRL